MSARSICTAWRACRSLTRPCAATSTITCDPALGQEEGRANVHVLRPGRRASARSGSATRSRPRSGKRPIASCLARKASRRMIQGWAVVDNTQDEDWENVQLSLVAGLAGVVHARSVYAALHPAARRGGAGDDRRAAAGGGRRDGTTSILLMHRPELWSRPSTLRAGDRRPTATCWIQLLRAHGHAPLSAQLRPCPGPRAQARRPLRV